MSFWGPRIERYRWEDYEHDTLYDFINSGSVLWLPFDRDGARAV